MALYKIYRYLVYIPWLGLWTMLSAIGVMLVAPFSTLKASRWCGRMWGRGLMYLVPAKVRVVGQQHLDQEQSYIVVSNHLSLMDIPTLYGWLKLDILWVMKKELRKVPFLGIACARLGHIFLDRSNRQVSLSQLRQLKGELLPGMSIIIFPEGTRSRNGKLQRFKGGAFLMAKDLELPILPISMVGSDSILPPDGMGLRPGSAKMIIHPPIDPSEVRASSPEQLRDRARQIIATVLEE
jgi:1-acyl-sn-glycerol-3-phosphate acyltransferase